MFHPLQCLFCSRHCLLFIDYQAARVLSVGKTPYSRQLHVLPLIHRENKVSNISISFLGKQGSNFKFLIGLKLHNPHDRMNENAFPLGTKGLTDFDCGLLYWSKSHQDLSVFYPKGGWQKNARNRTCKTIKTYFSLEMIFVTWS